MKMGFDMGPKVQAICGPDSTIDSPLSKKIAATKNALGIGPLTIADGVTVTVASGGSLTIL